MPAKVPLDVDLEDKLVYGLTPARLGYLVVAVLAAYSIWSEHWGFSPLRGALAAVIVGIGVVAAWGRWRGRAADRWVTDAARFVAANYRIEWISRRPLPLYRHPKRSIQSEQDPAPLTLAA